MSVTGGQAVVAALDAWGVDTVFGIPGIHSLPIYDALHGHPRIRHINARHEQGAGFMADGYARASGRPGVVLATTGPGVVNALTPLAQAHAESSPLLLIASGPPEEELEPDAGTLHEMLDQQATVRSVVGRSIRVRESGQIPAALDEALRAVHTGRPRPFALEIPLDVLAAETAARPIPARREEPAVPALSALERAAALLRGARRPLLIVGRGAQDATDQILALAEHLAAPVARTTNGMGAIPDDHPLALPDTGPGKLPPLRRNIGINMGPWIAAADVCLAVGTRLGERSARGWDAEPRPLIHLDIDPSVIGRNVEAEVELVGDAAVGLKALLAMLEPRPAAGDWPPAIPSGQRAGANPAATDEPFAEILRVTRRCLERDGIVVADMTMVGYRARRLFPVYAPRTFFSPHYWGTLGFAAPGAIGAKLARPDRQVVALSGDGGFLFTAQELATAVAGKVAVPIVICNDDCYAAIRQAQDRNFGSRHIAVGLTNPDFVRLARAFGAGASRVATGRSYAAALRRALGAGGPTVIEVDLENWK